MFAHIEFLRELAIEDVNNHEEEDDNVLVMVEEQELEENNEEVEENELDVVEQGVEENELEVVEEGVEENEFEVNEEVMEDIDEGDDGIETDAPDVHNENVIEMALNVRHETPGNVELMCCTGAFVVVRSIIRQDIYLCTRCYISYTGIIGPNAIHRHASMHSTTEWQNAPSILCAACGTNVVVLGIVQTCCMCNNVEKKTRPK